MTSRLGILLISALWLLLAVTLGSCSQIYDPEGPCEQEQGSSNRVSFKFKIYTDYEQSRSRGLGEWEELPANVAERILNPKDLRVLLINADGYLVKSLRPSLLDEAGGFTSTGGDGYYELSIFFEDDNLDRLDNDETLTFSVIVFANINSLGGNYTTDGLIYGARRDKLQELFTMPADWFPSNTNGIPMYGYKNNIHVTKADLEKENYNLGDIHMLRAMCKIEVFDNVENTVNINGTEYPHVSGVEMISWRDKGYLRTLHNDFESGLTYAYIPTTSTTTTATVNAKLMNDGGSGRNENVFRIYCPEAHLNEVMFRIWAVMAPGEKPKSYDVSLKQYADGGKPKPVFGDDLVRNHIYRFDVKSFSANAELTVKVSDWVNQTEYYTLDDIIEMEDDGYLTWEWGGTDEFSVTDVTYNGTAEKQLSMLNGTTGYATGTFHIKSPQDAVWRAYFIPGENGVDAFEFVDVGADGKVVAGSERSFAEGVVGERATIHIRGKGPADAYRHTAELVVMVRQPDGSVLYAPLTSANSSRYIIFREDKL